MSATPKFLASASNAKEKDNEKSRACQSRMGAQAIEHSRSFADGSRLELLREVQLALQQDLRTQQARQEAVNPSASFDTAAQRVCGPPLNDFSHSGVANENIGVAAFSLPIGSTPR
jgi:hypothetical protein